MNNKIKLDRSLIEELLELDKCYQHDCGIDGIDDRWRAITKQLAELLATTPAECDFKDGIEKLIIGYHELGLHKETNAAIIMYALFGHGKIPALPRRLLHTDLNEYYLRNYLMDFLNGIGAESIRQYRDRALCHLFGVKYTKAELIKLHNVVDLKSSKFIPIISNGKVVGVSYSCLTKKYNLEEIIF